MPTITVDELRAIDAPAPTKTWNPIPHYEIFEHVNGVLAELGISTIANRIDVDKSGNNAFITHKLDLGMDDTTRHPELGWRSSINKKFSYGITAGATIVVCSNLVFNGKWMQFQKHDQFLNGYMIREMTFKGVSHAIKETYKLSTWHDQMLEEKRSQHHADHLFMEMLRTGVISTKQILDLSNGYDEEKERYGETLYSIYNAATQTFRGLVLNTISEKSLLLNNLMKQDMGEIVDITPEQKTTEQETTVA